MTASINVPLLDLKSQYAGIREEIHAALDKVLESQWFIMGPEMEGLEKEMAEYCDSRFAMGCASGSDAILLALMAIGVEPGDEVIIPDYTFFATAGSVARLGARPVFVDIDPVTYNIDPDHLARVARGCRRLKAIMPVHLYGQVADLDACLAVAEECGVPMIEDAAQAVGARDPRGRAAGSTGLISCFSFFPTKNLGAYGDGGAVTTNDEQMLERLRMLRNHGGRNKYENELVGMNSRLDAMQAAILRVKLGHLEGWHEARRRNAAHYDQMFGDAGARTSDVALHEGGLPLRTPWCPPAPARHIYNQYIIRVPADQRDRLREHLRERNIGSEVYYPIPLHLQACFEPLGGQPGDLPVSEACARETIALPIYPELTAEQREYVASTIVEYVSAHAMA